MIEAPPDVRRRRVEALRRWKVRHQKGIAKRALRALESVTIRWECQACGFGKDVRWSNWVASDLSRREGWLCKHCGAWK